MLTTSPNSVVQKRDLHVGGLGASASGALAAVTEPSGDAAESWLERVQDAARDTEYYLRANPWVALAVAAAMGVAAGYLLAGRRRS